MTSASVARNAAIEWPTLALFMVIYGLWLALVWFHAALPLWLWLPLAAWTSAWWGSAQHEALHGHPTRLRWLNTALATPPVWLWMPFERYRQTHLKHHRDERLTDPLDDPETRYKCPDGWRELGPLGQKIVAAQTTLLGRLVIGPFWSLGVFWREEALAIRGGDRARLRIWLWHGLWSALLIGVVTGVAGMPLWQYLLGFVYCGTALALVRSFAEHKAEAAVEKRTAIVEKTPVFGLLFLHNNLHVAHHKWPTVPRCSSASFCAGTTCRFIRWGGFPRCLMPIRKRKRRCRSSVIVRCQIASGTVSRDSPLPILYHS
jgi:fatty acid desaturase